MIVKDFKDFYVIITNEKDYIVKKENCTIDVREEKSSEHKHL